MKFSPAKKRRIEERAKGLCEYCQCPHELSPQPFSIEHIFPKSKHGTDDIENLALACQACNNSKYNKTEALDPLVQNKVALYNPRKGRATVNALKMNRERIVNIRKFLYLLDKHPPK